MRNPVIARGRWAVVLLAAAVLALVTTTFARGPAVAVDGPVDVVFVATGVSFPDALAGGTLASTVGAPLLLVKPTTPLPSATSAALALLDPERIVILGGPGAVSNGVRDALVPYATSGEVTRIAGTNRYGTAAAIADALPAKVHDADRLDGQDSPRFMMHWIHVSGDEIRSHSPGLEGVTIDRPASAPEGTYCLHLPDGVSNPEAAVGSAQDRFGGVQDYGIAVTTTRGHTCNDTGPWDIAVDTTIDGSLADTDFSVMFPAGESVSP